MSNIYGILLNESWINAELKVYVMYSHKRRLLCCEVAPKTVSYRLEAADKGFAQHIPLKGLDGLPQLTKHSSA